VSTLPAYARDRGALWAALMGGVLLGVAVALDGGTDHHWSLALRNFELFTMPPFGVVLSVVGLALLLSWAIPHAATVWRARHMVAIGIVLFCSHLMGLGLGVLNPILFAILLFFAVWLLDRLRNPQAAFHPTAFTFLVLGFCALALISTLGIPPKEILIGLLSAAPKLLLALLLADVLDTPEKVRRAMSLMLWAAALFSLVGIVQATLFYFFGIEFSLAAADYRYAHTPFGSLLRATGLARFANQYAPPLVVAALMAVTLLASPAGKGHRLRLAALLVVTVAAVGLSIVRGAWTGLAIGLLVVPFVLRPDRSRIWAGALLGLVVLAFATGVGPWLVRSMSGLSESSLIERRSLLIAGLNVMFAHPLKGVGILNFGQYSPAIERHPVHNAFVQAGSELGIPALVLYVAIFLYVAAGLLRAMRTVSDRAVRAQLAAVLVGLLGLGILMQGEPMAYAQFVWIYLALGAAASRVALAGRA